MTSTLESGLNTGIQRVVIEWSKKIIQLSENQGYFEAIPVMAQRLKFGNVAWFKVSLNSIEHFRPLGNSKVMKILFKSIAIIRRYDQTLKLYETVTKNRKTWRELYTRIVIRNYARQRVINKEAIQINPNDILLIADAFWNSLSVVEGIYKAKEESCKIVLFVHDLIPISNPEFFEANSAKIFKEHVPPVILSADCVVTASLFVEKQVRGLARYQGPIRRVDLGSDPKPAALTDQSSFPGKAGEIAAVMVGTLEPRKNHVEILDWYKKFNRIDKLIIIGRPGWKNLEILRKMKEVRRTGKRVEWHRSLSDADAANLLSTANIGICASFVEGYGLPLREFIKMGIPVVASSIDAFMELTKEQKGMVSYFSIGDLNSLEQAIADAIKKERSKDFKTDITLWEESAEQLLTALKREGILNYTF